MRFELLIKKLVDVYAKNPVKEINNKGYLLLEKFDKDSVEELSEIEGYEEAVEFVKTLKKDLERMEKRPWGIHKAKQRIRQVCRS